MSAFDLKDDRSHGVIPGIYEDFPPSLPSNICSPHETDPVTGFPVVDLLALSRIFFEETKCKEKCLYK